MKVLPYEWNKSDPTCAHAYFNGPVLSLIPSVEQLKIADLGCGNGYMAGQLVSLGHTVCAVDSSETGISIAKQAYPSVDFHCLSLYENIATLIGNDFDIVISSEVIEHLYDPRTFLKNASSILKPGGTLILTTPYHGYLKNLVMALAGKLDNHFTVEWDCGHIKFFSVKTLSNMVTEQGFGNIRFKFAGRFPYLWKSMILCATK